LRQEGLPTNEHDVLDSCRLDIAGKSAWYARALRALPIGLSEWAVHPALDTPELRAIKPERWQIRPTDLEFLLSVEARGVIAEEGIVLLSYKPLQQAWQGRI